MNARINEHVVKYVEENEEKYKGIDIQENDLWHLKKIIHNKIPEKEKHVLELKKDNVTIQLPMRLFNLTKDITPE